MEFNEEASLKIKKLIKELEKIRGRHTELVSVYVPAGYNLVDVINQLKEEQSTASNIKSKTTRKNVLGALEKIIQHLKIFKSTPPNGLVVFAGNVSPVEGKEDIKLWSIEPPEKLSVKMYWCDQVFVLDPLKEMVREKEVYGLIVLDARDATIGLLKGKRIVKLKAIKSTVPSKTVKGGMCLFYKTLVLTNKGEKQINKIRVGDKIYSFDIKTNEVKISECMKVFKRSVEEAWKIIHENGSIVASGDHKFFTREGEKFVSELKRGDVLLFEKKGKLVESRIKNIQPYRLDKNVFFYDLQLSPVQNFFANGLLVHNSQHRYDRLREDAINEFLTKVGDVASDLLLQQRDLSGVIIGGPGPIKERFASKDYLNYQLKKKILGVKDISYTDEYGLKELVKRSEDLIEKSAVMKEKNLLAKFFRALKQNGLVILGYKETKKALEMGAVDTLLISEKLDWYRVKLVCPQGHEKIMELPEKEMNEQKCDVCGEKMKVGEKEEMLDILAEEAKKKGTKVEFISVDTEEGKEFKALGGIGGFLRFKI